MIQTAGMNFNNVRDADDFLLVHWQDGQWDSTWYPDGTLADEGANFFREIYLEGDLCLPDVFPEHDLVLLEAARGEDGWRLVWDVHGYLRLFNRADGQCLAGTRLPPGTFVDANCRIALILSNHAYGRECRGDLADTINYSQISLLVAKNASLPLRCLFHGKCEQQDLPPVPLQWIVPDESPFRSFRAFNTVRNELWQLPNDPGGPQVNGNFAGASRVFRRYDAPGDTLHLLSGPEFLRTDSYWLFTRIENARPGQSKLRLYLSKNSAMPNMAPVFFWSVDRRNWQRATLLEASSEAGLFQPLLTAPAEEFYLSSSIPFLFLEHEELLEQAIRYPFVRLQKIGESVSGHPITLLTATDRAIPVHEKKQVLIIIGQHSPQEMIGAHCILPMLEELAKKSGLLQKLALHIVPTVNVDGAAWGSDGLNLNLLNTNRCWFENLQPEVLAVENWCRKQPGEFFLFFDWHAGGTWRNHTLLWFNRDVKEKYAPEFASLLDERQQLTLQLLGELCGIRPQDGIEHYYRNSCATDWFQNQFPKCLPLTIEFSTCSNYNPETRQAEPVTQQSLTQIGQNFAKVMQKIIEAEQDAD